MFKLKISLYGIFMALSLFIGMLLIYHFSKSKLDDKDERLTFTFYIFIGALLGAQLYSYCINYKEYETFDFFKIGFSAYGAAIGIFLMILLFSCLFKKSFLELVKVSLPVIPLMYSIGKLGCFFAGCCYGINYSGIGKIVYSYSENAPNGVGLFPVQLCESISFFIIFISIYILIKKQKVNNYTIEILLITCSVGKFFWDFFRYSHKGIILSSNQIVSLLFFIIGISSIVYKNIRRVKIK